MNLRWTSVGSCVHQGQRSSSTEVVKKSAKDVLITPSCMCIQHMRKRERETAQYFQVWFLPDTPVWPRSELSGYTVHPLNTHKLPHTNTLCHCRHGHGLGNGRAVEPVTAGFQEHKGQETGSKWQHLFSGYSSLFGIVQQLSGFQKRVQLKSEPCLSCP